MSRIYRYLSLTILILPALACSLASRSVAPTETLTPPSDTPAFTATTIPSNTPVQTDTLEPSITPSPSATPAPLTATWEAMIGLQTQMVATAFAQFGASAHLSGFLIFYSNPVGTPLESWNDVPIMQEATAGQEFQPDIYSYKANASLEQGTEFYTNASKSLNWSCFPTATGSGGSGAQSTHSATFICGPLTIIITSFDNEPGQVLIVINKAS